MAGATGRRAAWLLLAAAIAGAALASAGSAATLPPYLFADGFEVYSNALWAGAKELGKAGLASPRSGNTEQVKAIWSRTCKPGRQTVGFTRAVELLGPPAFLDLAWSVYGNDVSQFELAVNGRRAYVRKRPRGESVDLRGASALFRIGRNELDVHVTKPARAGLKACNTRNPLSQYAVAFRLAGSFKTDLELGTGPPAYYQRERTFSVKIGVRNKGPTRALDVQYEFNLNKRFEQVSLGFAPPTGWTCTDADTTGMYRPRCTIAMLEPGRREEFLVRITLTPDYEPFAEVSTSSWSTVRSATPELDSDDNTDQFGVILCGTLSRLEGCTSLPK